jgi:hypothetical protein
MDIKNNYFYSLLYEKKLSIYKFNFSAIAHLAEGQFLICGLTWNTEECRRLWTGCPQKPKIISITKTEAAAVFSPSLEPDGSSESHEVDRVIPNPKVRYRIHNNTWLLAIRRQTNPVHIFPFHLFNLSLLSTAWFPNQSMYELFPSPRVFHSPGNPTFLNFITRVTF